MTCEMCWAVFKGPRCPTCGHEIEDFGKRIEAIDAQLEEIRGGKKKEPSGLEEEKWYGMFEYHRRMKNYAPGWTAHKYNEKFGVWPRDMQKVAPVEPDLEFTNWIKHLSIKWRKGQQRQQGAAA